ncbi:hypothetical protein BGZ81_005717 [Podila clonocystis]|nr:hypothetical protein BGZ81_005717 [Podila clonocystis]
MLKFLCKLLFGRCQRASRPVVPRLVNVLKPDAVEPTRRNPADVLKPEAVNKLEASFKPTELPKSADVRKPEDLKPEDLKPEDLKPEDLLAAEESIGQVRDEKKVPEPGENFAFDKENDLDDEPSEVTMYQQIGPSVTLQLVEKMEPRAKCDPIEKKLKEKLWSSESEDLCVKIESVLTLKPSERTELHEKLERFDEAERRRRLERLEKQREYERRISDGIRELWYILPCNLRSGRDKASIVSDSVVYMKNLQQDLSAALTENARLETATTTDDTQQNDYDAALQVVTHRFETLRHEVEKIRKDKKNHEEEDPHKGKEDWTAKKR